MHPAIQKKIEAIQLKRQASAIDAEANDAIQTAIDLGEITLTDGKLVDGPFTIQTVTRKTWEYTDAVKALQEQEVFEGVATLKQSTSFRYTLKND